MVPLTVLVAVFSADWVSAAIMLVTLPLVPIFMALVGMETQARTDRQLRALQLLVGPLPRRRQRADDVEDLRPVEGTARAPSARSPTATGRRMMATLRVTFLSSLVLELLASVSVALVAVAIGLRLLDGHLEPADVARSSWCWRRRPTCRFASSGPSSTPVPKGSSAAEQVFDVLDRPGAGRGTAVRTCPTRPRTGLVVESVGFTYPGRDRPALDGVTFEVRPRRGARPDRAERVRQVDAAGHAARFRPARRRDRAGRRRRPGHARP